MSVIDTVIERRFRSPKGSEKIQKELYATAMILLAGSMHVIMGVYFLFHGPYSMAALSFLDVTLYAGIYLINRSGRTRFASFSLVFKVLIYALLASYLLGPNVNAQWLVLSMILPTASHLDFTKAQRIALITITVVALNLHLVILEGVRSPLSMDGNFFLEFFFGNIVLIGLIVEFALNVVLSTKIAERDLKTYKDMSYIDPLTNLNNRRYADLFFEQLRLDDDFPCAVCLLDIDDFKAVNDTYGHDVGDAVLQAVAAVLRKSVRMTDLSCRWGGEEFLLGIRKCAPESARAAMDKIRLAVEREAVHAAGSRISVTITGGLAVMMGRDLKAALDSCDQRLYEGKRSGKNKIVG